MALTLTELNAYTNDLVVPRTTDVIYKDDPLFMRLMSRRRINFDGGRQIQRPLMHAELNGDAFTRGSTFNTAYVETDTALVVNPKYYYVGITLYGEDDIINRGRQAAFSQVELKFANASKKMAKLLAQATYRDGQSSAGDVTTSAGILSASHHLDGLLAWVDDGSDASSYQTATGLTKSFAAVGGITRNDMFNTAPTFSGAVTPASAVSGLNSYVDRDFAAWSLTEINTAYGYAQYGSDFADLLMTTRNGWNRFWVAIQPNQRYLDKESDVGKIGFKSLRFNSSEVVVGQYMPENLLLGLNTKYIEMYITTVKKFQFGFTGFKEAANSLMLTGQFLFAGNLLVANPRTCFKVTGAGLS